MEVVLWVWENISFPLISTIFSIFPIFSRNNLYLSYILFIFYIIWKFYFPFKNVSRIWTHFPLMFDTKNLATLRCDYAFAF